MRITREKTRHSTRSRRWRSSGGWIAALALLSCLAGNAYADSPLLVVFHGDRESAATAAARWRVAAKQRGFEVLALQCPEPSWWKWNGDPQWVKDRIAKVRGIDRARVYAAGWSGGATYLGMRAHAWSDTFAAIVVHGGGMAPSDDTCTTLPAYFLVGDKNPLHRLAVELREFFVRCESTVEWDLVRGGDHAKERRALDAKKARAILDWLSSHERK